MPRTPPPPRPRQGGEPPPEFIQDYKTHLIAGPPVLLDLDGHIGWVLMTVLQKIVPVPAYPRNLALQIEPIARQLQRDLSRTPALAEFIEDGWHPDVRVLAEEPDPRFVQEYSAYIVSGPHVFLKLTGHQAWTVCATLQMAVRFLPMPPRLAPQVADLARVLEEKVGRTPVLARWAARGWDGAWDRIGTR